MGKTEIELRDDVYERLLAVQRESESISDTVNRLLDSRRDEHPLEALSGILDDAEAERLRERSRQFRENVDEDMDRYSKSS